MTLDNPLNPAKPDEKIVTSDKEPTGRNDAALGPLKPTKPDEKIVTSENEAHRPQGRRKVGPPTHQAGREDHHFGQRTHRPQRRRKVGPLQPIKPDEKIVTSDNEAHRPQGRRKVGPLQPTKPDEKIVTSDNGNHRPQRRRSQSHQAGRKDHP